MFYYWRWNYKITWQVSKMQLLKVYYCEFLIIFIKCVETFFFISGMTHLFYKPVICTDIFDIFILFSCFNHDYWFFVVVSFLLWFYVILFSFFIIDGFSFYWMLIQFSGRKIGKIRKTKLEIVVICVIKCCFESFNHTNLQLISCFTNYKLKNYFP